MTIINKLTRELHHIAPIAMAISSAVGVIVTTYEAVKETPKAIKLLEEAKEEKGEDLDILETVKTAAPAYKKTIISAASTIAIIAGNHIFNQKQQVAIMGVCQAANKAYSDYQDKTKELYGEEAHERILAEVNAEKSNGNKITASTFVGDTCLDFEGEKDKKCLFYLPTERRFFESTAGKVLQAEYHLNRNFTIGGYALLNDFYKFLGIKQTRLGDTIGWTISDGDFFWIDFDHRKMVIDGKECFVIDTVWEPCEEYLDSYL